MRSFSADSHTPLPALVCFPRGSIVPRPYSVRLLLELPSAQSPFARARCHRARHDGTHHVSGHSPTCIALTGSCASPQPSRCLGYPRTVGLCRLLSAPAGRRTFPTFSLRICPCVLGPLPRWLLRCSYPFLPSRHRPSPRSDRVGAPQCPCSDFSTAPLSRLQSFADVQARRCAHHPGRSYRYGLHRMAAVVFTSEPLVGRYLPTPRICLPSESGN